MHLGALLAKLTIGQKYHPQAIQHSDHGRVAGPTK
jgi:hypothetical protein